MDNDTSNNVFKWAIIIFFFLSFAGVLYVAASFSQRTLYQACITQSNRNLIVKNFGSFECIYNEKTIDTPSR